MIEYTIKPMYGCYQSFDKDGNKLIFSGSEWECRFWTEDLLNNQLKDGKVVHNGTVHGKL